MKISVVVTVFNLEKFVYEAITSVLNQTRVPDEIIVIDDCSTDTSALLIQRICDQNGLVKYFKTPENSGVLLATLMGIERSSGDIISFLDGDDIWENIKLEEVENRFIRDHSCFLVTHGFQFFNNSGQFITGDELTEKNIKSILHESKNETEISARLKNSILCHKGVWLGSAYSILRSKFDIAKFKTLLSQQTSPKQIYQDHPIAIFMVTENIHDKVAYIDQKLFRYRMHGLNSSGLSNDHVNALKTAKKGLATSIFTSSLVFPHKQLTEARFCQAFKLTEFRFLVALYEGKKAEAFRYYIKIILKFRPVNFIKKESLRLIGIICLGNQLFFYLKNKSRN